MVEIIKINLNHPDSSAIIKAADFLKKGKIIIFPTDTVYGLGTDALNIESVKKIFFIKNRPLNTALPIAVLNLEMAKKLAYIGKNSLKLIKNFWPGALTIILKKKPIIPLILTGGSNKIGIRMPNNPITLSILKKSHIPLVSTSANRHGFPPSIDAINALAQLDNKIDLVIDGGKTSLGISSTIIDMTKKIPCIFREGPISKEEIERIIGTINRL